MSLLGILLQWQSMVFLYSFQFLANEWLFWLKLNASFKTEKQPTDLMNWNLSKREAMGPQLPKTDNPQMTFGCWMHISLHEYVNTKSSRKLAHLPRKSLICMVHSYPPPLLESSFPLMPICSNWKHSGLLNLLAHLVLGRRFSNTKWLTIHLTLVRNH